MDINHEIFYFFGIEVPYSGD